MIVLLDNYDSFTYNIAQYCLEEGANLKVVRNNELSVPELAKLKPDKLIISPGPSTPNEAGITLEAISFFKDKLPIFGVCLGHQAIGQAFGANVIHAKKLMHGKIDNVKIIYENTAIFAGMPREFKATRYHSLAIERSSVGENIIITAETSDEEIMAIEIKDRRIYGVQFHPESVMSEYGHNIIRSFLAI